MRAPLPPAAPLLETRLPDLAPPRQGMARDIYEVGDHVQLVATDRSSEFDYVLGSGMPAKGKILTQDSAFWYEAARHIVPNQVHETIARHDPAELQACTDMLAGRSMLV